MPTITTKFEVGDTVKVVEGAYSDKGIIGTITKISWWSDLEQPYYLVQPFYHQENTLELYEETATDAEVDDLERRVKNTLDHYVEVSTDTVRRLIARMDKTEAELLDLRVRVGLPYSVFDF